ncbi:UDP-glucuronosyltransferase 3A1-like isoform X2 [Latimeria chalumnae]
MDEISHLFHERGHEVRMLLQTRNPIIKGLNYVGRPNSYQITAWSADDEYVTEFNMWFLQQQEEFLKGRESLSGYLDFIGHLALQCDKLFMESDLLDSLRHEKFDIALLDAFNPCSFLIAERLGLHFVAVFPGAFFGSQQRGIPSPPSYVPVYRSLLSDHMNFWERLKNCVMFLSSFVEEQQVQARFEYVIQKHFPAESRPLLSELYMKPELWVYNTDFTLEFARPLLPNIVVIGGLLSKPPKPVSQNLEEFIANSEQAGFMVVTLGSMLSSVPVLEVLKEMNSGFSRIPQAVIWRYQRSLWPKDLQLAPNVKLVDWLPQNDLLGHPKCRLLVTHGGINSLMQAVYHSVPVLGIPLFGDQFDNLVRVETKQLGIALKIDELKAHTFANTMKKLMQDKRYKLAAIALSKIHRSQPFPPGQRLIRWVEHVLHSGGGGHLHPYSVYQPLYQQYLIDVILFIAASLIIVTYVIVKVTRTIIKVRRNTRKFKLT